MAMQTSGRQQTEPAAAVQYTALVAAIAALERAFGQATSWHDARWVTTIDRELRQVRQALTEHLHAAEAEHGLLAEVLEAMPRADYRVRQIRSEHRRLIAMAEALLAQLEHTEAGDHRAVEGIRQEIGAFLGEVRQHMSQQVDLIYDAYEGVTGQGD